MKRLPNAVKVKIVSFQAYVQQENEMHSSHWTEARQRIQDLAENLAEQSGNSSAQHRLLQIASWFCVKIVYGEKGHVHSARLTATRPGFICTINAPSELLGWTYLESLAHELGHVLFYSIDSWDWPKRLVPMGSSQVEGMGKREEWLCNDFSRALLLPSFELRPFASTVPDLFNLIDHCRARGVPLHRALHRLYYDLISWEKSCTYWFKFDRASNTWRKGCFRGKKTSTNSTFPPCNAIWEIIAPSLNDGKFTDLVSLFPRAQIVAQNAYCFITITGNQEGVK